MQVRDFVASVLTDVLQGIRKAQEVEGVGAFVVPAGIGGHSYTKHARVSIGAEESSSVSGGGGVKVAGIGGSVQADSVPVPILLPESQKEWYAELKGNK